MILDELVLHNFGVYKGEQRLRLTPSSDRPVVLIGALNGGGKTTLLEALQIALFGRNSNPAAQSKLSYPDFLRSSIHHGTSPSAARVEVAFRYVVGGQEQEIRVVRTWSESVSSVKERLEVYRDGLLCPQTSERWLEFVEEILPHQISDLFFFDGEKIESLADPTRSAELLRVGVHALLGLDLIDDLVKSLSQVERRRKSSLGTADFRQKVLAAESAVEQASERRRALWEERATTLLELDEGTKALKLAERQFATQGGDLFDRQEVVHAEVTHARRHVETVEDRLRELAGGPAPLLLVRNLLEEATRTAKSEVNLQEQMAFAANLERRDFEILRTLRSSELSAASVALVEDILSADRSARTRGFQVGSLTGLRPELLELVSEELLQSTESDLGRSLAELARAREALAQAEAKQAAIPEESKLQDLRFALDAARSEVERLTAKVGYLTSEHERVDRECQVTETKLQQVLDDVAEAKADDELAHRVMEKSAKCRLTLQKFRAAMRGKHIARLEALVTQSFQTVLRKKSLVRRVSIDPDSFALHVVGPNGASIPPERLSAGERQMLAVSMLWGLARASGRHLPAVIDTPLGRLDSEHRNFLIRNYFPVASHQVILLSTDEEINGPYYSSLRPHVAREYLVQYDHSSHASSVAEGYFPQVRLAA